jgi:hypothetical protein
MTETERVYIDIGIWERTRTLNTERSHTFILIHIYTHKLKQRTKNLPATHTRWLSSLYTNINIHARVF